MSALKNYVKPSIREDYPKTLINKGLEWADKMPSEQLQTPKNQNNEPSLVRFNISQKQSRTIMEIKILWST